MSNHAPRLEDAQLTRREALCRAGMGFGALALSDLMAQAGLLAAPAPGPGPNANPSIVIDPLRPWRPGRPSSRRRSSG